MSLDNREIRFKQVSLVADSTTIIELKVKPISLFFRLVLCIIFIFSTLAILRLLKDILTNTVTNEFVTFCFILVFIFTNVFLFRMLLWNWFGKEIIEINEDQIIYTPDYKLFKDGIKKMHRKDCVWEIIHSDEKTNIAFLKIAENQEEELKSVVKVNAEELNLLVEKLKNMGVIE